MTGQDARKFRERRGLSRNELAELLNEALGKSYTGDSIGSWERPSSTRNPPKDVAAFLEQLALSEFELGIAPNGDGLAADDQPLSEAPLGDSAPGGPALPPAAPAVGGGSAFTKMCEELWELVATGVGMVGAATGSQALIDDGAIIAGDKQALGKAWGKLAERNETFRKMLVGMSEGGAWMEVALVTGTTVSKCWQQHQFLAWQRAQQNGSDGLGGVPESDAVAA